MIITEHDIQEVMEQEPSLTWVGFWNHDMTMKARQKQTSGYIRVTDCNLPNGISSRSFTRDFEGSRQYLAYSVPAVQVVCDYLKGLPRNIIPRYSVSRLKGVLENWLRFKTQYPSSLYIHVGSVITSCIISGFPIRKDVPDNRFCSYKAKTSLAVKGIRQRFREVSVFPPINGYYWSTLY